MEMEWDEVSMSMSERFETAEALVPSATPSIEWPDLPAAQQPTYLDPA